MGAPVKGLLVLSIYTRSRARKALNTVAISVYKDTRQPLPSGLKSDKNEKRTRRQKENKKSQAHVLNVVRTYCGPIFLSSLFYSLVEWLLDKAIHICIYPSAYLSSPPMMFPAFC